MAGFEIVGFVSGDRVVTTPSSRLSVLDFWVKAFAFVSLPCAAILVDPDIPRRDDGFAGMPLADASRSAMEELDSRFKIRDAMALCESDLRWLLSFGISGTASAFSFSICSVGTALTACSPISLTCLPSLSLIL